MPPTTEAEAITADVETPREDGADRATHTDSLAGDDGMRWQPGEPVEADRLAGELAQKQRAENREQRAKDAELRRAAAEASSSTPAETTADASRRSRTEATAAAAAAAASQGEGGPNGGEG